MTLMEFLVQTVEKHRPAARAICAELDSVEAAVAADVDGIRQNFVPLKATFDGVKKKVEEPNALREYVAAAQRLAAEVDSKFQEATTLLRQSTVEAKLFLASYGEDPEAVKPPEFFGSLLAFLKKFEATRKELEQKRADAEMAAKLSRATGRRSGKATVDFGPQQRGVMEDLLAKIRGGQLKRVE
jgi:hypothetical protein